MITPVILCGGMGTRLWPVSRETFPKQFLVLEDDLSLFQITIKRVLDKQIFTTPIIICNEQHKFRIASQLEDLGVDALAIILEPMSKNTAPAIALAAHFLKAQYPDSQTMLVMPADHMIKNTKEFHQAIISGKKYCQTDLLVTFGVTPTHPSTAYGYIEPAKQIDEQCFKIKKFIEKPDRIKAQQLIRQNAKWNSGIFMFKADSYLHELKIYQPLTTEQTYNAIDTSKRQYNFITIAHEPFSQCNNISIDYAIFEHTDNSVMLPIDVNWSDIGSWKALFDRDAKDENNNSTYGDNYIYETNNCLIHSQPNISTVTYGVDNLCIIATKDAVLVINKDRSEAVKSIVADLQKKNKKIATSSCVHYRPWGFYENLLNEGFYKVKKLSINSGNKISLQYHNKRSEHWVVTSGEARVTIGEQCFSLQKGQSTFIPMGTTHRLENIGLEVLEIIEVQIGNYLEEDDIVRLEDKYGRE